MTAQAEHQLLTQWGYSSAEATRMTGYVPSNGATSGTTVPSESRAHLDKLKYNAWFDDQLEADRLEAEGDELEAEVLRSSVNEIDDMYEAVEIGGSIMIRRSEAWGRLDVTDDLDDEQEEEEMQVVTEADVDALWHELHPDDAARDQDDDDDSGVVAIGTEHVAAWGHERRAVG